MKIKICSTLILAFLCTYFIISFLAEPTTLNTASATNQTNSPKTCPVVYLPTVMNKTFALPCSDFNNHCEDNDSRGTAYGPLKPNIPYVAYPDDQYDYYFFMLPESITVTVQVSNYYASGQLQLRDDHWILIDYDTHKPDGNMEVGAYLEADTYFVRVSSNNYGAPPYTLQVSYSVTPPPATPPPPPKSMVFEDFEAKLRRNWWSPDFDVFTFNTVTDTAKIGDGSLLIDYVKTDDFQFIASEDPIENGRDLSWAQALDVWVYGAETLLLKLEQNGGFQEDTHVLTSTETLDWTLFRYDLSQATTIDLSQITQFVFFPAPGDAAASGTFYIDHMIARDNYGLLGDFEFGEDGRLMKWWTPDPENIEYHESNEMVCNIFKITYQKDAEFQFIGAEVPPTLRDWQWARGMEVWVYGEVTLLVALEDEQQDTVDLGTLSATNPTGWTRLPFYYDFITDEIDLSTVRNIFFYIEPGNSNATGIIYFDDIALFP